MSSTYFPLCCYLHMLVPLFEHLSKSLVEIGPVVLEEVVIFCLKTLFKHVHMYSAK